MKTRVQVRIRWWAKLFTAAVYALAAFRIKVPLTWCRWVCERSTEFRFGNQPWTKLRVSLREDGQ